jgi:hypothetical protein
VRGAARYARRMRWIQGLSVVLALGAAGCRTVPVVTPVERAEAKSSSLTKLHMRDGRLFVLHGWKRDGDLVRGDGEEYDIDRLAVRSGPTAVPIADIAMLETSKQELMGSAIPMALATAASLSLTVFCAANPKACFGSCPTFYAPTERGWTIQAEGFSTSIASSLEADDLDDLPDARPAAGWVTLAMRNEALETHAVRRLSVLAVDGPAGSSVLHRPDGAFDAVGPTAPPRTCSLDSPACDLLAERDARELSPESDGKDLAARTSITLRFDAPGTTDAGLVLTARNSLMSTFVLYHMYALHGSHAGDFIDAIERKEPATLLSLLRFALSFGGIDIEYRQDDGPWRKAGSIGYVGPIARATQVVPLALARGDAPVEVRLTMARAHFRIDAVRLGARLAHDLPAVEVPAEVEDAGERDPRRVEQEVRGAGPYLVTLPGDEIRFRFHVPEARGSAAYFLESRGFYHEWMRPSWLREEDLPLAQRYLADPPAALRELAPLYRTLEPTMETIFQNSRFARPGAR